MRSVFNFFLMTLWLVSTCYRPKSVKTNDLTINNSQKWKHFQLLLCIPQGLISFVMIEFTAMNYLVQGIQWDVFYNQVGKWVQPI